MPVDDIIYMDAIRYRSTFNHGITGPYNSTGIIITTYRIYTTWLLVDEGYDATYLYVARV